MLAPNGSLKSCQEENDSVQTECSALGRRMLSEQHARRTSRRLSMVFLRAEDHAEGRENWTFVVVTDRIELDDEIAKTFKATATSASSSRNKS